MELYTLNNAFRNERVFDRFISLIWTERWQDVGEVEVVLESTTENKQYLTEGVWLGLDVSHRCMRVDSIEDKIDDDGRKILKITGPSMEILMDERAALPSLDSINFSGNWVITGLPAWIARKIFTDILANGTLDPKDQLVYLWDGIGVYPADTIPEPTEETTIPFQLETVLQAVKKVCSSYDMGFRLFRYPNSADLRFDIYMGNDRTTGQSTLDPVIFSPEFENLRNITSFKSSAGTRNVAYVLSSVGAEIVVAPNVDPNISDHARKVLIVAAEDIDNPVPAEATAEMIKRGQEELAKYRSIVALDGEISQVNQYVYDVDYYLGDIVEMRHSDGDANFMRVTEQIFVSDEQGDRAYPTLTVKEHVTPDSWAGWPNKTWFDYDSDPLEWEDA